MNREAETLPAAYGGTGWRARPGTTHGEMGSIWGDFGNRSEWAPLRAVLLHEPGAELEGLAEPDAVQMLEPVDAGLLRQQHRDMAGAYRAAGVTVHSLRPSGAGKSNSEKPNSVPPNTMFMADLFFMTPEGAILARPASAVRAGEERLVALRLAELGVPILRSVHGDSTFEGADALWLDENTLMAATGLRTNEGGLRQVEGVAAELGVRLLPLNLPSGAMHLMGSVRLIAPRLAAVWPSRLPPALLPALEERDYRVISLPDEKEGRRMALNFVTLAPMKVLMPAGCPLTQSMLESAGVECISVEVGEIVKAAGGIACLTGILQREAGHTSRDAP